MFIDWMLEAFNAKAGETAIVWNNRTVSYRWLSEAIERWQEKLSANGIAAKQVVAVEGDFSPNAVALLFALIERSCIIVPLTNSIEAKKPEFLDIAQVQARIILDETDEAVVQHTPREVNHPLMNSLLASGNPGLIVFSSGSTGKSKAALHDFTKLLDKFRVPRKAKRMISFLLFDHLGGINTILYILSNGGAIVTVPSRDPEEVCRTIEAHRVEVLPTSPTFIKLMMLSEAYTRYDLSSLQLVTYGTEPMSESTLKRFHELFPNVDLQQTYGLSELGVLRSKSKSADSLWVKIGGEGFETRIVNGLLEIKSHSAMLGYLNAPSSFTEDGWFMTGDAVEIDGDYMLIKGRVSEMINVGGEKVYPAEVEGFLMKMDNVRDVVVTGEPNPITGQIVTAQFVLAEPEDPQHLRKRVREFCRGQLPTYKIPVRIGVATEGSVYSPRFKKLRPGNSAAAMTKTAE